MFSQCNSNSVILYIPINKKDIIKNVVPLKSLKRSIYVQLSKTVWHFCSSNGNFCRFIQQWSVAWTLVEMITVPSGDMDVRTSFSDVPKMEDDRSLAKNRCGTHKESRRLLSPMICSFRFGATSLKTNRGSTYRSWTRAWILNCCELW